MMQKRATPLWSLSPLVLALTAVGLTPACSDEPPCPPADLPQAGPEARWAVVTSDYLSTAVGLLREDGTVLEEAWVDSGSAPAGIVAALSGDVALPSAPSGSGELLVIDRFGVDVVSRFDLRTGTVLSQARTQLGAEAGGGGFRSNPQDARVTDGGALFVSRFAPNPDPSAPPLDQGNDLVELDAEGPVRRIDFGPLNVDAGGTLTYARPGRIARLGDYWVVGLGRLSADFMTAGPGAVAVLDSLDSPDESRSLAALLLPDLANCPEVRQSPTGDSVFVVCSGDTFTSTTATRRDRAGVVRIVLGPDGPALAEVYRAAEDPAGPVPSGAPVPLDDARVVVVSAGDAARADALFTVDLASLTHQRWHEAGNAFVLGTGAFDPGTNRLLMPDADEGLLRFTLDGLTATAETTVDPSPCRGLPAREVTALAF